MLVRAGKARIHRHKEDVVTDQAYLEKHAPIVKARLQMAGVRLGAILNKLFDADYQLERREAASLNLNELTADRPAVVIMPTGLPTMVDRADRLTVEEAPSTSATDAILAEPHKLNTRIERLEAEVKSLKPAE